MAPAQENEVVETMPILVDLSLVESRTSGTFCLDMANFTCDGAGALHYGEGTTRECAEVPRHSEESLDRLISQT
ncbi:hypothetical protein D3C84_1188250 [compost metagenome]